VVGDHPGEGVLGLMVDAVCVLTQVPAAEVLLGQGVRFYLVQSLLWGRHRGDLRPLTVARY
jgi:hypothetical protein